MSEHTIPSDLHQVIVDAVDAVRCRLGNADIGGFTMTISASGRTMTEGNEVKIDYRVSPSSWETRTVTADTLDNAVDELIRREAWNGRHQPLSLTHTREAA